MVDKSRGHGHAGGGGGRCSGRNWWSRAENEERDNGKAENAQLHQKITWAALYGGKHKKAEFFLRIESQALASVADLHG